MKPFSFSNIQKSMYAIGVALVILGALFKIQHWPGSYQMLVIGIVSTLMSYVFQLIYSKKIGHEWILLLLIGVYLLKQTPWAAGIMNKTYWNYLFVFLALGYAAFYFYGRIFSEQQRTDQEAREDQLLDLDAHEVEEEEEIQLETTQQKAFRSYAEYLFKIGAFLVLVGALFKVQHWPFASIFLIVGMTTTALYYVLSLKKP